MTAAFPLSWPDNIPRSRKREAGTFKTELRKALSNVETSLRLFGSDSGRKLEQVVISSNVTLGISNPPDPGVAVWFVWDGEQVCIPVDRYSTVQANLQAIHHIIEARRVELRHGTLALVRATLQGFKALPPPPDAKPWTEVLGLPSTASEAEIRQAYLDKAKKAHPDAGGSKEEWEALERARNLALQHVRQ